MSDNRDTVVVLGMHRSGTSCISNLLTKCGVYFGDAQDSIGANPENPKGFFERRDIRWICDVILQGVGCDWWAVSDFSPSRVPLAVRKQAHAKLEKAQQSLSQHRPWFIKEPRLCMVWPVIEDAIASPVFLHVWRDPIEVARSLAARNGFPLDFGISLWEIYVRSAFRHTIGARSIIVSYNAVISAPKSQATRLVKRLRQAGLTGIKTPREEDINDAVDSELYRHHADVSLHELLNDSQRRLIAALESGNPEHPEFAQPVSAVSIIRVEDWVRREGAALSLKTAAFNARGAMAESARLRTTVIQLEQSLKATKEEHLRRVAEQMKSLEQQRATFDSQGAAERASLLHQIEELTALANRQSHEGAAIAEQRSKLDAEIRELRASLSRMHETQRQEQAVLQQQAKDLVALLSARDREFNALRARLEQAALQQQQTKDLLAAVSTREQELQAERSRLEHKVAEARKHEHQLSEELRRAEQIVETDRTRLGAEADALRLQIDHEITVERKQLEDKLRDAQDTATRQHEADKAALADALGKLEQADTQATEREAAEEVLRAQIAARDTSLQRQGETLDQLVKKFALMRENVKRRDTYIEKVRAQIPIIRKAVTRQFAREIDKAEAIASIKAKQLEVGLAYAKSAQITLALQGMAAHKPTQQSRAEIRRGLVRHYTYVQRRKDAQDLATIALSGLFDPSYYLKEYGDVAKAGIDPLIHYTDYGVSEHRNPSALFDTAYYMSNTDGVPKGVNPVLHYLKNGLDEARPTRPAPQRKVDVGNWALPAPPPPLIKAARKPFTQDKRVVIYTAVSGGYDVIEPPAVRPPNCDFVIFSDQPVSAEGWQVRPINYVHADPTRAARFTKLHPHFYFPDYEYSIWIDGNIGVIGDIREFLNALTEESAVGIFAHPLRRCIYVEGEECIKRKKDAPETINKHLARYRAEGFPRNAGLWETNVVVRRHNDPNCIALMDAWWREMEIGSRRDQLSLPVVANRLGAKIAPLDEPGANARDHDLVNLVKHPAERRAASTSTFPATVRKKIDAESIPLAVGICVHNSPVESKACIESVLGARGPNDVIIVIDDASDGHTAAMLDGFARDNERLRLIRHEQNRGYTQSANQILKNSQAPWSFLLNSDTVVPPRALRKIVACGEQFDRIGIVGPLSNAASWQSVPSLTGADGKFKVNEIPPGLSIADMDQLCEELATGIVPFVPLLNGFCYAIRRKLTETIGFLDEKSFPVGYGEEDDFSLRAGAAGYVCAIATDAYIYHTKSATFTADRRRPLVEQGAAALRRKHSPERLTAAVLVLRQNPELTRIRDRMTQRLSETIREDFGRARHPRESIADATRHLPLVEEEIEIASPPTT